MKIKIKRKQNTIQTRGQLILRTENFIVCHCSLSCSVLSSVTFPIQPPLLFYIFFLWFWGLNPETSSCLTVHYHHDTSSTSLYLLILTTVLPFHSQDVFFPPLFFSVIPLGVGGSLELHTNISKARFRGTLVPSDSCQGCRFEYFILVLRQKCL